MYAVRILETVLMEEWMSLIFLGIAAYYDVRHRRIPLYVIISALAAALVMLLCLHHEAITGYVGGAAIGIVLLPGRQADGRGHRLWRRAGICGNGNATRYEREYGVTLYQSCAQCLLFHISCDM